MATLQVVSVTPNDHVLPVTAAIQIRFSRNDTTFNNVRVRVCKNGSVTSGNVAVIDVTSSTTFNGADGRTVLTYGKLTSQGGVEEGVTYSLDITCFDTAPTVLDWTPVTTFAPYRRPTISSFVPAINAELDGYPIECSWVIDPGGADGVLKSQTLEITDITDAAAPSRVYYSEIDPALREVALTIADVQLSSDRSYRFTLRPVNDVGLMAVLYHDTLLVNKAHMYYNGERFGKGYAPAYIYRDGQILFVSRLPHEKDVAGTPVIFTFGVMFGAIGAGIAAGAYAAANDGQYCFLVKREYEGGRKEARWQTRKNRHNAA